MHRSIIGRGVTDEVAVVAIVDVVCCLSLIRRWVFVVLTICSSGIDELILRHEITGIT